MGPEQRQQGAKVFAATLFFASRPQGGNETIGRDFFQATVVPQLETSFLECARTDLHEVFPSSKGRPHYRGGNEQRQPLSDVRRLDTLGVGCK